MTASEIIAKVNEAIQSASISPSLDEVNGAIDFIASLSYLPSLVTLSAVAFMSSTHTITDATNASPIVITTNAAHGLSTGALVVVTGVLGNTAADGTWYIEVLSDTTLRLLTSEGNSAYISGGTITKRDDYVGMPSDFDHDLFEAFSITQDKKLIIRSNLKAMSALHDAYARMNSDVIEDVAIENGLLHGMPIGDQDDVVMCKYYRKPTDMGLTSESPTCIPQQFHETIIVPYILSLKWPLIEDGIDGSTPNTDRALNNFSKGMAALAVYYPRPSIAYPTIERHIQYF